MRLRVQASEMAAQTQPGQFYMLKAWEGNVPFLMRPISVNSADQNAGTITFLYKVVGEGTKLLAALQAGDALWALGPLGHGFPVPEGAKRVAVIGDNCYQWATTYLAVTGGVGVVVPLDKELGASELEQLIIEAECAAIWIT